MANSFFNQRDFTSFIRDNAPARSDRFEILMEVPEELKELAPGYGDRIMSLMCEEMQLPGYSATNVPVKIGAWTEFRNQNLEFLTQDVVFTFLSDGDLKIREMFEKWIELSVDPVSKEVSFTDDVKKDIVVRLLDKQNNVRTEYIMIDALPKLININQMSWSNNTHLRISVSFAVRKWYRTENGGIPPDGLKELLQRTGLLRRVFNEIFD